MKVKAFVLIFVVFSLYELAMGQSAAEVTAYKDMQQACIKELNVPAAEAALIATDKEVTNPSDAYKCYHSCLYKKLGLLTADGKPNNDILIKFTQMRYSKVPVDKIKAQLATCGAATKKDAPICEYVYNYEQCMVKALKA